MYVLMSFASVRKRRISRASVSLMPEPGTRRIRATYSSQCVASRIGAFSGRAIVWQREQRVRKSA